jgi:hypothetical protein
VNNELNHQKENILASYPDLSKGEGLTRTHDLIENLINDVYRAFEVLDADKESQFLRRSLVRTVFSFIEGVIHVIKFEIRSAYRLGRTEIEITRKEREILYEEREKDGEITKIFIATDDNLKKTFNIAKKVWELNNYRFNAGGSEYKDFQKAKRARDKLTHPRTFYDIEITKDDMFYMVRSFDWIRSEFSSLMSAKIEKN